MVSVEEATRIIQAHLFQSPKITVNLEDAIGRNLAEPIFADRDFPPFDRVMMDGVGVQWSQLQKGARAFRLEGIQQAGSPKIKLSQSENGLEVMTGAVCPEGVDVVIRYEDLEISEGIAHVKINDFQHFQNIHARGRDVGQHQEILSPGIRISPAEIALLASVGKTQVGVFSHPNIAIVTTGDELVDIHETPAPHQIRRSNGYALQASLKNFNINSALFHIKDDKGLLSSNLERILADHDSVILSGGVSKGKYDYIPEVLETLGLEKLFYQVSQRPGKPFWFGHLNHEKTVFALPGNPVSTYLCFYRYILPWLQASLHNPHTEQTAVLQEDFEFTSPVTFFLQVKMEIQQGQWLAQPVVGKGSGDFANLHHVDGFLELPLGGKHFKRGHAFRYISFR